MIRRSPPKHRHDGTSPLPLGMDWSLPPRKWSGRYTVWPHDYHSGWSYCVTIPSWVVLPKARDSDPVVFYRVQVGLQSPEGISTVRGVLRRFNDFLKLFADLKKAFPKKNLPPAPPKGLLRMKSRALLEERRCSLEQWMTKLLSDIDLSRSIVVASFLDLEAAARSSFQDADQQTSEGNHLSGSSTVSLPQFHSNSTWSGVAGGSSITSDYGSDTAYETSELGTPRLERDVNSEVGIEDLTLDEDLTSPLEKLVKYGMSNIDEGLFMGQAILEQLEGFPQHKVHSRQVNSVVGKDFDKGNTSKSVFFSSANGVDISSEQEYGKVSGHARKLSTESIGSDISSLRGSEISISGIANGSFVLAESTEVSRPSEMSCSSEFLFAGDAQVVLPLDQRHKMNRVLITMQRRLVTAKTDMEDLIARLNQEIAVKDYLMSKVKDLEVELETTKQKSKENLQQATLLERERVTQMQWDMEEIRRKNLELELKLKSEQDENVHTASTKASTVQKKDVLLQELDATKEQLTNVLKQHQALEIKSRADIKVLVKEVKSLRSSQTALKQELSQSLHEKFEKERQLEEEKQRNEHTKSARRKLMHECKILQNRLLECSIDILRDVDKFITDSSSLSNALDLLTTSDNQIGLLLAEAQLLGQDSENTLTSISKPHDLNGDMKNTDDDDDEKNELRKMLINLLTDDARLRKHVNSVTRRALKMNSASENDHVEVTTTNSVQSEFLQQ